MWYWIDRKWVTVIWLDGGPGTHGSQASRNLTTINDWNSFERTEVWLTCECVMGFVFRFARKAPVLEPMQTERFYHFELWGDMGGTDTCSPDLSASRKMLICSMKLSSLIVTCCRGLSLQTSRIPMYEFERYRWQEESDDHRKRAWLVGHRKQAKPGFYNDFRLVKPMYEALRVVEPLIWRL